ncbi:MAG: AsnC family transcriptional regulator [Anaerolineae bacterium]|nr:AsnC family transcriptional regulator [Anaerolineae bacterium]
MDATDRQLLDLMQAAFPLSPAPFAVLGEQVGLDENTVLAGVRCLMDEGIIRQIGPIFDSQQLGYRSTLVAFSVAPERLEEVAARVNAHPGVSHNYARDHVYNLWFTLTLLGERDIAIEVERIAAQSDVEDYLNLPALRTFRLGVHFDLSETESRRLSQSPRVSQVRTTPLSTVEREVVRATQGHLPLTLRPFAPAAARVGISEEALLDVLRAFEREGVMRRFAVVLRHRQAGFRANGMGCWVVPEERIGAAGEVAATFRAVSHCYQRPAFPPRWPYNLFTMIHGHEQAEVEAIAGQIRDAIAPEAHTLLYSVKEFKKERVRYFEEEV